MISALAAAARVAEYDAMATDLVFNKNIIERLFKFLDVCITNRANRGGRKFTIRCNDGNTTYSVLEKDIEKIEQENPEIRGMTWDVDGTYYSWNSLWWYFFTDKNIQSAILEELENLGYSTALSIKDWPVGTAHIFRVTW